ncbi:MAG: hydroxyisourate hydrolase [Chitinophagaceae bacterium]|nr:hydroxyisourate hydrolase [Chitinophagaceae bacterium]MBK9570598.1 hydroxyisourate hydrolase [Chitinophagaceae bacterium]MBL0131374.1 hydroxyisourate hydrolase [Chitinophagaceae bacterium]MBL0274052.1 hydroxyisourate hydrolase [Chitinophagaceae bacterium]
MSQLTTHILDTTKGKPAKGVTVVLFQQHEEDWKQLTLGATNGDGRIPNLLQKDSILDPGIYKMKFGTKEYFESQGVQTFYPFVEITFTITGSEHYHIPLLITPFGYSTYRGS